MSRRLVMLLACMAVCATLHAAEELDLQGTTITGNRELPKVLYIVPWKGAEPGELAGRPVNSVVDEVLAPLDREEFRRRLRYYDALHRTP